MHRKRLIAGGLTALMVATLVFPVSAHCGRRRTAEPANTACYVCPVEDCTEMGRHSHDGTVYCGYDHADGICDGQCLDICPVEGCTIAGRHTHDGTAYCGTHHEAGFCDGSCQAYAAQGGRHHGRGGHHC